MQNSAKQPAKWVGAPKRSKSQDTATQPRMKSGRAMDCPAVPSR